MTSRRRRAAAAGVVAALVVGVRPAGSQVLVGLLAGGPLSSEKFNIGFDIGVNFSTLTGMGDASRYNGPLFGLFADWRFSERFHFTGGLIPLSYRGANQLPPVPLGDAALDSLTSGGTMARSMATIDVPLILKFALRKDTGPRLGVGPQFSFVLGASDRYEAQSPAGKAVVLEEDIGDQLTNIDAGFAVDFEWRWPILAIGVRYYYGLTDLVRDNPSDAVYSRVLSGSGRIPLGRKPPSKK